MEAFIAALASVAPVLPQLGGGGLLLAFAIWRERAHNAAADRWASERAALVAEKTTAVEAVRAAFKEDDERRDRRIAALVAENEALEKALDEERAARRQAQDQTVQFPRHRLRPEGTAS